MYRHRLWIYLQVICEILFVRLQLKNISTGLKLLRLDWYVESPHTHTHTHTHTQHAVRKLSKGDGRFMARLKYHSFCYGKETETGGSCAQGQGTWHAAFMAFTTTSSNDTPFVIRHSSNQVSKIYTARDIRYPVVRFVCTFKLEDRFKYFS